MRLSGADLAVMRQSIGLTLDELAAELKVNPRTVRSWEQEREPVPVPVRGELLRLLDANVAATDRFLDMKQGHPIELPRTKEDNANKGWLVAAAARAFQRNRNLKFKWYRKERT